MLRDFMSPEIRQVVDALARMGMFPEAEAGGRVVWAFCPSCFDPSLDPDPATAPIDAKLLRIDTQDASMMCIAPAACTKDEVMRHIGHLLNEGGPDAGACDVSALIGTVVEVDMTDIDVGITERAREATDALLAEVITFIRRFLWLPGENEYLALGLWILHTHAFDAFARTPYLAITSPERECGKTQCLELLEALVAAPWKVDGIPSEAVIFRKIAKDAPTLLIDEVDLLFRTATERQSPIISMLNAGYKIGATVPRCTGDDYDVKDFSVYCAKALAGIDITTWPDTLQSRCVPILLHRMPRTVRVERWRSDREAATSAALRARCARWAVQNEETLSVYRSPTVPELHARAEEVWEPLLAIADRAGCFDEARDAAVALSANRPKARSTGATLLGKLRDIFKQHAPRSSLRTQILLDAINADETLAFGSYNGGDGMTPRDLARELAKYGVKPGSIRDGDETGKGYKLAYLTPAWDAYAPLPADPSQTSHPAQQLAPPTENHDEHSNVTDVTDVTDPEGASQPTGTATDIDGPGDAHVRRWQAKALGFIRESETAPTEEDVSNAGFQLELKSMRLRGLVQIVDGRVYVKGQNDASVTA